MVAARNSRNAKRGRLFIFAFLEILAAILPDVIHPLGEGPARLGPVHGHVGNVPHGEQIDLHHVHSTGAKLLRGCELEDMSIRRSGSAGASPSRWWRTPNYRVDRAIPFPLRRSTINHKPSTLFLPTDLAGYADRTRSASSADQSVRATVRRQDRSIRILRDVQRIPYARHDPTANNSAGNQPPASQIRSLPWIGKRLRMSFMRRWDAICG